MAQAVEIVRIKPKAGALPRLQQLRPQIESALQRDFPGRVSGELVVLEDGSWCDIWRWADRADADKAVADATERYPAFVEWVSLVEEISLDWGEALDLSATDQQS